MSMTAQQAAARVTGFNTRVQWNHFRQTPNPQSALHAHISVRYGYNPGVASLQRGIYRYTNPRATVSINADTTWVRTGWFQGANAAERAWLLRHEQGHYDLIRLVMRDLILTVGSLECSETVVSALRDVGNSARERLHWAQRKLREDADAAVQQHESLIRTLAGTPPADGLYDTDTDNANRQARQNTWNRVFDRSAQTGESLGTLLWVFGVHAHP